MDVMRDDGAEECVELLPISTCQRHELYCLGHEQSKAPVDSTWLGEQADAALRLFQLAAGLLSNIPGEKSIAGQLQASQRAAQRLGICGRDLGELVRRAILAGRVVRERTSLAVPILELEDLVRDLVLRETDDRRLDCTRPSVLLLGAGEMARSLRRALQSTGFNHITWATRHPSRHRGPTMSLGDALERPRDFDVVIAAIANAPNLIDAGELHANAVSIDLSVPAAITAPTWPLRRIVMDAADRLGPQREALRRAAHRLPALADAALAEIISPSVAPAAQSISAFRSSVIDQELRRLAHVLEALPSAHAELIRRSIRHTAARCVHPLHEAINQLARQGRANEALTMIDHLLGSRVGWTNSDASRIAVQRPCSP